MDNRPGGNRRRADRSNDVSLAGHGSICRPGCDCSHERNPTASIRGNPVCGKSTFRGMGSRREDAYHTLLPLREVQRQERRENRKRCGNDPGKNCSGKGVSVWDKAVDKRCDIHRGRPGRTRRLRGYPYGNPRGSKAAWNVLHKCFCVERGRMNFNMVMLYGVAMCFVLNLFNRVR